jgi:hypothetical protein
MRHERHCTAAEDPEPEIAKFSGAARVVIWVAGVVGSWALLAGIGWIIWRAIT